MKRSVILLNADQLHILHKGDKLTIRLPDAEVEVLFGCPTFVFIESLKQELLQQQESCNKCLFSLDACICGTSAMQEQHDRYYCN